MNPASKKEKLPLEKKILMTLYIVPACLSIRLLNNLGETFMGRPVYTLDDVKEFGEEAYQCLLELLLAEL